MLGRTLLAVALMGASCALALGRTPRLSGTYVATAYAQKGITASGEYVHRHVVAADPTILPIGSRIKIRHAGRYSGEYVVADTGEKIQGRKLDIYLPDPLACKKFGVKRVKVKVIQVGDGTKASAKAADVEVKKDVQRDVTKNVVGNAATQEDWLKKQAADRASGTSTSPSAGSQATTSTATNH